MLTSDLSYNTFHMRFPSLSTFLQLVTSEGGKLDLKSLHYYLQGCETWILIFILNRTQFCCNVLDKEILNIPITYFR